MDFLLFLVYFAFKVSVCFLFCGNKRFFCCLKRKEVENLEEEVIETSENAATTNDAAVDFASFVPEDPQRFSSSFITDDYVITIVHDITLGDVLLATLLCVLIIAVVLGRVIGGVSR